MDKKMFGFKSRTASVVVATGLAMGILAVPAYADSLDTSDYVSAAARRAAAPAPEILGLSGVEECATAFFDGSNLPTSALSWQYPKYYLFGTSEYNVNPNPYMYNLINDYNGTSEKTAITNFMGSPNTTLAAYASTAKNSYQVAVWNLLPDVIIGNADGVNYNSDEYAKAAGAANNKADYTTVGVEYSMNTYSTLVNTMYNIADAGDQAARNTGKQLRYGSATKIAEQYEAYVKGTQGYVMSQLEATGSEKKVVALVTNYDKETGTYTLMESNVQDGTASSNRYLETVENVSTQLNTIIGSTTATSADLDKCDLIMFGSQRGGTSEEDMLASLTAEQKAKAYYVDEEQAPGAGSCYGVTMNSVENAANVGRILGCLYPEYIDQDNYVAYYFDNFYHIKADKIADAVDKAMDGIVNWDASTDARTTWTAADCADYNEAEVQAQIDRGLAYIQSAGEDAPSAVQTTNRLDDQDINITDQAVLGNVTVNFIQAQKATGKTLTPEVTVNYNGSRLVEGVEYKVSYENNINPGYATVTITGIGAFEGTVTTQFRIWTDQATATTFSDVTDNDWAKDTIAFCNTNGLLTGYDDGTFGTYNNLTRAQAAVVLWRFFEPEAAAAYEQTQSSTMNTTGKTDVENFAYYTGAVNWAIENGIMNGDSNGTTFRPNDGMQRQELFATIANAAEKMKGEVLADNDDPKKLNEMPDAAKVESWAVQSMAWCLNTGAVNGVNHDGVAYADPTVTVDRSTMSAVMYNLLTQKVL